MHHWMFFPPFCFLFILLIGFFVANIVMWRRRRSGCYGGPYSNAAHVVLDKRLASGEIDIEEYKKLKEVLNER